MLRTTRPVLSLLTLALGSLTVACGGADEGGVVQSQRSLEIAHFRTPCGEGDRQLCLVVQDLDAGETELWPDSLPGFAPAWGRRYVLSVDTDEAGTPAASHVEDWWVDKSSFELSLEPGDLVEAETFDFDLLGQQVRCASPEIRAGLTARVEAGLSVTVAFRAGGPGDPLEAFRILR